MKTYEKMKAAIVDLSNVLDEALAFEEFKKTKLQPAFAGNAGGNIRMAELGGDQRSLEEAQYRAQFDSRERNDFGELATAPLS